MKEFDKSIIEDPKIFEQNRLPAHSDHVAYKSVDELETGESSYRLSLDGVWQFHYSKNLAGAPVDYFKSEYDTSGWDRIHVPAHIQMEGYDRPQYVNVQYPWDGWQMLTPPEIPTQFNPVGDYVKYFDLPDAFKGERVCISFQGVESGFALWLNGRYV